LGAILLWSLSATYGWLPTQILPPLGDVGRAMAEMWQNGDLVAHTSISLQRVLFGFTLGALAGLSLGIAMGLSPTFEDYVKPLFSAIVQVPAIGWIPLLMLWLGIDEALKIVIIAKGAFVPMAWNTYSGIRNVPAAYIEGAKAFRFSRWQLLRKVILPAAVPPIFTGIRYGLTHAWGALVAVELLASSEGLGYLLVWGRQMFWLDVVLVAMILIGAIGFLMDAILATLERRLQRWRFES
jgi:sulfonate transport system permease protein